MNVCALNEVKKLLGGDTFSLCDSVSLRLEKFVRIGGDDAKSQEISMVTGKRSQTVPHFIPPRASVFTAILKERLIVDQAGGVLENAGLCLHPHFNAPMIPGSAVKGVARHAAWCEWTRETDPRRKKALAEDMALVFGYPTGDKDGLDAAVVEGSPNGNRPATSGAVGFLPAYPDGLASLTVDILTPHGGNDWTNPVPCAFPVVEKGTKFVFTIVPVFKYDVTSQGLIDKAIRWLKIALSEHGVGAKVNAGYGRFQIEDFQHEEKKMLVNLHFASPAFLRGADDNDCSLRIPTLRGMLRWWWRWLYRCYLSDEAILDLETKIWGGAGDPPKASCISLSFASEPARRQLRIRTFDRTVHFGGGRRSGIAYLSYGMDERSHGVRRQRRVLEVSQDAQWKLSVTVNARNSGLSAEQLAAHARVAIWALCSFGGIGSRSRKGFGSLCSDISYNLEDVFADMVKSLDGLHYEILDETDAPYAMMTSLLDSVETHERDAWRVLDKVGAALQGVADAYKHNEIKAVLGLPRNIHGPKREPMPHQRGHRHAPPLSLRADARFVRDRFAAPLSIHLEDTPNGINVKLTAFPSDIARGVDDSEHLLQECIDAVKAAFDDRP